MADGSNAFDTNVTAAQSLTPTSQEKLKQFVARIEKLEEEKKALSTDLKEVYAEAKTLGFDTKALRGTIKFRKQDKQEREEQEAILELYLAALGDI
ncbi:MAG: DUF2312 domain-containing protein [Caulobacterales bacterium]